MYGGTPWLYVENKLKEQTFQKNQCWWTLGDVAGNMALLLVEWVGKDRAALALCILAQKFVGCP